MSKFINGNCALCTQVKDLPFCRDSRLICADCEKIIKRSLETEEHIECAFCNRKFSWLWGEFLPDGRFMCANCKPGGLCFICHKALATMHGTSIEGKKCFVCRACFSLNKNEISRNT